MTTILKAEHISKTFTLVHNRADSLKSKVAGVFNTRYCEEIEKFHALDDINMELRQGEAVGIIGRNGCGKSTFLKIASGIYQPTSGSITCAWDIRIGTIIELGVGFNPELTGRENVFLSASMHGLFDSEIEAVYDSIVEFSGLDRFMDVPMKNYSTGMQVRLGFALESTLWPQVLLVDEVLAVGDAEFQERCKVRMHQYREKGGSIMFVSHSMASVMELCDRCYVFDAGRLIAQGTPKEAATVYEELITGKPRAGLT